MVAVGKAIRMQTASNNSLLARITRLPNRARHCLVAAKLFPLERNRKVGNRDTNLTEEP